MINSFTQAVFIVSSPSTYVPSNIIDVIVSSVLERLFLTFKKLEGEICHFLSYFLVYLLLFPPLFLLHFSLDTHSWTITLYLFAVSLCIFCSTTCTNHYFFLYILLSDKSRNKDMLFHCQFWQNNYFLHTYGITGDIAFSRFLVLYSWRIIPHFMSTKFFVIVT